MAGMEEPAVIDRAPTRMAWRRVLLSPIPSAF